MNNNLKSCIFLNTNLIKILVLLIFVVFIYGIACSQKLDTIKLISPDTTGGKPIMKVLKDRKTNRDMKEGVLSDRQLSDLLWAAYGINRPDGRRTAPSAMNKQEIDIYVALKQGLFMYEPNKHVLLPVLNQDVRGKMGASDFVSYAAAVLIYVADYKKMGNSNDTDKVFYSAVDAGFIGQNVYLYCASVNLASVVMGGINREAMSKIMNLRSDQKIILSHCIGIPAK